MASADLPIDIQVEKFIDWLVSRQKVPANWSLAARDVRATVTGALTSLPIAVKSKGLTTPDGGSVDINDPNAIHYFHCLEMQKLIAEATANASAAAAAGDQKDAKSSSGWSNWLTAIGGAGKDQTTKLWESIVAAYQKNNIYLADCGRIMSQNTTYEIPALRKTVANASKQTASLERKITECEKSAKEFQLKYADACKQLHVSADSKDVRAELKRTAEVELDPILNSIVTATKQDLLGESIDYYREFTAYQLALVFDDQKNSAAVSGALLPTLIAVRSQTTAAPAASAVAAAASSAASAAPADEDDFGITIESTGAVAPDADANAAPAAIDWGAAPAAAVAPAAAAGGISWGDEPTAAADTKSDSKAAASSTSGSSSLSLDNGDTRQSFVTDLLELEAFLQSRIAELSNSSNDASAAVAVVTSAKSKSGGAASSGGSKSQPLAVPSLVSSQSVDRCTAYASAVRDILSSIRDARTQQLITIRTSARAVDRIVATLNQKHAAAERLSQSALDAETRLSALQQTLSSSQVRLRALAIQTISLKRSLESALSKLYDNRKVNIFGGDINSLEALTK